MSTIMSYTNGVRVWDVKYWALLLKGFDWVRFKSLI